MAKFLRTKEGIGYLEITVDELINYSKNYSPICDFCGSSLLGDKKITLIPILDEAFCEKCSSCKDYIKDYYDDRLIRLKREEFYRKIFNVEKENKND